ncbi:ATP-binding protein [Paenibacillus athensensis]|uniref:Uncharacterized protein n=1 Tax=Paenibacillus athensensis TaxID=1967502 RepID=A0A4Y8Q322_9BACL|nr:ATP-binding protein [Paenibacillus athensensis]MCD1259242.1 ATP-binding protein [Paenibacillus athensensis]
MGQFHWGSIKEGFRGFENLAYEYVQKEFENASGWNATPKTRDGNKDAFTIVVGYQPYVGAKEEWWMEAKYSTESEKLSRYKLDATIVSAILHGHVSKIIFVTNISIHSKTMIDIRRALESSTNCKEVTFCTKSTLEYWLSKNSSIYNKYFDDPSGGHFEINDLFILEEIKFYSSIDKHVAFREALQVLYEQNTYSAFFSVFSAEERTVKISIDKRMKSFCKCKAKKLHLKKGENTVHIDIYVKEHFSQNGKFISGVLFLIENDLEVLIRSAVNVFPTNNLPLYIHSQHVIEEDIHHSIKAFMKKPMLRIHSLFGDSGIGKTYLLNKIVQTDQLKERDTLYLSFSSDSFKNRRMLLDLVLFILFPFMSLGTTDREYLTKLMNTGYMNDLLIELFDSKDDPDRLSIAMCKYSPELRLLPNITSMNKRFILMDDLHKLFEFEYRFLTFFLQEISLLKFPIFFLLCGQKTFFMSKEYQELKEFYVLTEHPYELGTADLISSIQDHIQLPSNIDENIINALFLNTFVFFKFIQYIKDSGNTLSSIHEFVFAYKMFQESRVVEQYIIDSFRRVFNQDSSVKEWCDQIYRSSNGLDAGINAEKLPKAIDLLLREQLIRFNYEGRLVPFHDIYADVYKKSFGLSRSNLSIAYPNKYEEMHNKISIHSNMDDLKTTAQQIIQLKNEGKYYSILYILESVFMTDSSKLKDLLGDVLYYKLYFVYAYAMANQSKTVSGRPIFEKIYQETKNNLNFEVMYTCTEAISELVNSKYESLDFQEAEELAEDLEKKIEHLVRFHYLQGHKYQSNSYILAQEVKVLILSEKNDSQAELAYKALNHALIKQGKDNVTIMFRYARTLYVRDVEKALELLKQCLESIELRKNNNPKLKQLITFDYLFLQLIMSNNLSSIQELIEHHEKMKENVFNDFRKGVFALSALFYMHFDIDRGNSYLFSDVTVGRKFRPRQEGFYLQNLSLYEIMTGNKEKALVALEQSRKVFSGLKEYVTMIDHNMEVIQNGNFSSNQIRFYTGGTMLTDVYYIDSRCCW